MKYIKGHALKELGKWTGKRWYHQRFDGSPYFMHFIAEAEIKTYEEMKKGGDFTVHYCFYDEGKADWYIEMDDIKKVYTSIIDLGKENPNISSHFIAKLKPEQDLFYEKCLEVQKIDLSELSDDELIKFHDEFVQITLNKNSSSSLIDGFALGTDQLIANLIKEVYDNSDIKNEIKFQEFFSQMTAPVHLSFINEAEVNLLKIAVQLDEETMREFVLDHDTSEIIDEIKGKKSYEMLKDHQKDYFWIRNNYVSSFVLSVEDFIMEIKQIFEANIDPEEEIKKITGTSERNKKRKEELRNKVEIPEDLKTMIKISEDFTYWQDERKKGTFWTTHYFSLILDEIGKRVNRETEDLKYMTPREMSSVFEECPDDEELEGRRKNGVYFWDKEGMEALYGKDADFVKDKVLGSNNLADIDDFRGLTANIGKAIGKVKILKSATEINKVEKGDILVAVMTRPDYIPAIRKAAAIVTNEGGVTCHAAIISREVDIPCIIGTKIATEVLKDGMLVEVNANHGWVRILKDQ